jgi:CubicO group peptidase (beta-lactamase class C family)
LGRKTSPKKGLDKQVAKSLKQWKVPGTAVAILHDGKVDAHGYGVTSLETRQPVTADTLFQIGSISKVFIATLIMQLSAKGKVALDAPLATYLPEIKLAGDSAPQTVTLRHLLSHTSGVEGDRFEDLYGIGDDALSRAVAEFDTLRQLTPPGEFWTYSNNGFSLAGAVVERVTEKPFEAVMREYLLDPLKLERSFYFAHEAITYPVAVGHSQEPGKEPTIARNYPLPRYVNPAGGIISTVEDLLRFALLHLEDGTVDGKRILSKKSVREMRRPQIKAANFARAYGIGWAIYDNEDTLVFGHGGSTNGFQAQLTIVPDQSFAIATLTNGGAGEKVIRDVEDWALAHYCGIHRQEPEPIKMAKADLARFTGTYCTRYTEIAVTPKNGALRLDFSAKSVLADKVTKFPPMTAKPISDLEFIITKGLSTGYRIDFIEDGNGSFRLRSGGRLADLAGEDGNS